MIGQIDQCKKEVSTNEVPITVGLLRLCHTRRSTFVTVLPNPALSGTLKLDLNLDSAFT